MRPTNRELLVGIAEALRDRVAPAAAGDAWAASELRSIDALLGMIVARDEHEAQCLSDDNADLVSLLAQLDVAIPPIVSTGAIDPRPALRDTNLALRTALEAAIHDLHRDERNAEFAALRDYLRRATSRDALLYGPLTGRPLF